MFPPPAPPSCSGWMESPFSSQDRGFCVNILPVKHFNKFSIPRRFVPLSLQTTCGLPCVDINLLNSRISPELDRYVTNSKWTALKNGTLEDNYPWFSIALKTERSCQVDSNYVKQRGISHPVFRKIRRISFNILSFMLSTNCAPGEDCEW